MQCGCIKNKYSAYLGSNGCKELIYEDESLWMQEDGYNIPETYTVTITTPSKDKIDLELGVDRRNRITAVDLFSSDSPECLQDGIYCFSTESCGINYQINRAFVCNLECKINKAIADNEVQDDFSDIMRYKALLEAVKVNAKQGNVESAESLLQYLQKELDRYSCDSC